jgi:hypothetical protein
LGRALTLRPKKPDDARRGLGASLRNRSNPKMVIFAVRAATTL